MGICSQAFVGRVGGGTSIDAGFPGEDIGSTPNSRQRRAGGLQPGELKWEFETGGPVYFSSPVIGSDGTVYVGSEDNKLYAIQGSSGPADSPWPMFGQNAQRTGRNASNDWNLANDLGNGWRNLGWFGSYYEHPTGWIYHVELGWLYRVSAGTDSIWLWHQQLGWLWTSHTAYPYLWRHDPQGWLYFRSGSESPRFYDYTGERWVTLGG